MKMMISRDRLREKIMNDPDVDQEAGFPTSAFEAIGMFISPISSAANDDNVVRLKEAFGVFIHQLRRREKISIVDLSVKARVDEDEIRKIENDPHHKPRPRTIHQLAEFFKVPERSLMKLSGATVTLDHMFQEEAFRFAAKSDGMSKLTHSEQKALNEYIRFLADHNGG